MFCDDDYLRSLLSDKDYQMVIRSLKSFKGEVLDKALQVLPAAHRPYIQSKLDGSQRCPGNGSEKCCFALSKRGGAARTRSKLCIICDSEALIAVCSTEAGIANLKANLNCMTARARGKAIEERIPEQYKYEFQHLLSSIPTVSTPTWQILLKKRV